MVKGGKKDESYIADLFKEKVLEYDPLQICTSVFYFDGGSNVQKAGEVLMARFPCTFCLHGGGHVDSLFFSSITKVKPIKIFHIFAPFYYLQSIDTPFFLFVKVLILKTCCLYSVFGLTWITSSMPNSWPSLLWPIKVAVLAFSVVLVPEWLFGSTPWCISYV